MPLLTSRERERERVNSLSNKRSLNKSFSKYISILCSLSSLSVLGSAAINHSCVLNKINNFKNANDNQITNKEQINNNINTTNTTETASAELFFSSYKSIKGFLNYSYNENDNTLSISCSSTSNNFLVEDGVFKDSIDIPDADITNAKIVAFPNNAFFSASAFKPTCEISGSLILPNTLETIGKQAFYNFANYNSKPITSVDLSKCTSLTTIGDSAFYLCGLTSISLPKTLKSIGQYVFGGCPIQQVNFQGNDTYKWVNNVGQGHLLFTSDEWDYQTSPIGCLAYGDIDMSKTTDLSEIKANQFRGCAGVTSVNLPNSITTIGNSAFNHCSGLSSISLPSSLTSISTSAFYLCGGLTSVSLPSSLTIINSTAFSNDSKINEVFLNFNAAQIESLPSVFNEDWLSNAVGSDKMSNVNVYFPRNEADAYLNVDNQKTLGIYGCKIGNNTNATSWIGGNVTSGNLFYTIENSNISPISIDNLIATDPIINSTIQIDETISYPINEIKSTYFRNNINLSGTLTIDKGITKIEANAFNGCENISGICLNWTAEQLKKSFNSNDDKLIIDPNWLGSLRNKQDLKIYVPKGTKTIYEKYKDQLGISNNQIVDPSDNNTNLSLILGLSLGLGIPALAGAITGAIIGVQKHKDKKLNKKKSKK